MVGRSRWMHWLTTLLFVLSATPAGAAQVELRLSGSELQVGQVTHLKVLVTDERPSNLPTVQITAAKGGSSSGIQVQFAGQGSQVRSMNGRTSRLFEFNYQLEALVEGQYSVGPAEVKVGGQTLNTRAVSLVVKPRVRLPDALLEGYAGFDTKEAWLGQILLYTRGYRSRRSVTRDAWSGMPEEGVRPTRSTRPVYTEYSLSDPDGKIGIKEEIHARIASRVGRFEIPAATARMEVVVGVQGRGFFSKYKTRNEVIMTQSQTLEVKALPPAPPNFTGLVGDFVFDSSIEDVESTVGASIPWVVTVTGDGSLQGFDWQIDKDQDGARLYDATPTVVEEIRQGKYFSSTRFEQVIVPTRPGTLELPEMKLVTFSPSRGEFVTHRLEVPTLTIKPGRQQPGAFESFVDKLDGPVPGEVAPAFEGVRPVYRTGNTYARALGGPLRWLGVLAGSPLILWMSMRLISVLRRWWRQRALQQEQTVRSPIERLQQVKPNDWATLASILQQAWSQSTGVSSELADRKRAVEQELDRVRFASAAPNSSLRIEVTALVKALVAEGRAA